MFGKEIKFKTVMANNYTNINNRPLTLTYWPQKYDDIQVLVWDKHKNVVELNRLMGSNLQRQYKIKINENQPTQIPFHPKKHHILLQKSMTT